MGRGDETQSRSKQNTFQSSAKANLRRKWSQLEKSSGYLHSFMG